MLHLMAVAAWPQSGGSFQITKSVIAGGGGRASAGRLICKAVFGHRRRGVRRSIFRPAVGEWWYLKSSTGGNGALQFGSSTGFWFILRSEDFSFFSFPFGTVGDVPSPGDYDGDGKFDATVFRPSNSTWFANQSTAGVLIVQFGQPGDLPVPNAFGR
jgi:hypothetical protein